MLIRSVARVLLRFALVHLTSLLDLLVRRRNLLVVGPLLFLRTISGEREEQCGDEDVPRVS